MDFYDIKLYQGIFKDSNLIHLLCHPKIRVKTIHRLQHYLRKKNKTCRIHYY